MRLQYVGINIVIVLLFLIAPSAHATPLDVTALVQQMKQVFEPARPSTRKVEIVVRGPGGEQVSWVAHQARVQQFDGKRTLLVMQEPEHTRGNALLIWEREGQPNAMWWYPPALRRVRKLVPVESYQRFFDSDLTYADLGYVDRQGKYRLLGNKERNGMRTYKVEFIPDQAVYYSRIITWIAADTQLPVQRDYYEMAGQLWKTMTFDQVKTIENIPTPLHIRIQDIQQDSSTDVTFSEVRYGVDLPETLFDPERLPQTVEARWWQTATEQVASGQ